MICSVISSSSSCCCCFFGCIDLPCSVALGIDAATADEDDDDDEDDWTIGDNERYDDLPRGDRLSLAEESTTSVAISFMLTAWDGFSIKNT